MHRYYLCCPAQINHHQSPLLLPCRIPSRISSALYPLAPSFWWLTILHGIYGSAYDLIGVGPIIVFAATLGLFVCYIGMGQGQSSKEV